MNKYVYLAAYVVPVSAFVAIAIGGPMSFLTLFLGFVVIPVVDMLFTGTDKNFTKEEEKEVKSMRYYDYLLYLNVPLQYGLLIFFLFRVSSGVLLPYEIAGMTLSMGMCSGVLGINVAHELGHRRTWYEQLMAKMLLLSTLYMHFFIEHNRGHHKNVSTPLDPASASRGQLIYTFWVKSIVGSYLSAWKLENHRVRKEGKSVLSWENEMVRFQVIQALLVASIFLAFGWLTTLLFLGASLSGYLLLETVNYIEHYGLRRKELSPGRYEKTMPWHSWNSDHTIGRVMLYDLTRHSDHHYLANRKYQVLRHFDESPQMPTGYPGCMVMSLFPPLWFAVMHPRIDNLKLGTAKDEVEPNMAMAV